MGKNELVEKIKQLNILVEKNCKEKKFGDKTVEFGLDFNDFLNNIKFFYRSSLKQILTMSITQDTINDIKNAIENLKDMKKIAEEYKENGLANFINSMINDLEETKRMLVPLVK